MATDLDSVTFARKAAETVASTLQTQIANSLTSDARIQLRGQLVYAINTADDLDDLEARLDGGETAMPMLTVAQVAELQALSQTLDNAIVANQLLVFSAGVAANILDSAVRVGDIVRGNMPST
jgi:hypothetical protein